MFYNVFLFWTTVSVFVICAAMLIVAWVELEERFNNSNEKYTDDFSNKKNVVIVDTDIVDRMINCQSSCQKQAINRHRHNNWLRANASAPNCGRKPRYKDHDRKRGLKVKESFAAWS